MTQPVRIGIVGDYRPNYHIHIATDAALNHAAGALGVPVDVAWLPTPAFDDPTAVPELQTFDGLWGSAGSPYESMQGALNAIRFAREMDWPFFAT